MAGLYDAIPTTSKPSSIYGGLPVNANDLERASIEGTGDVGRGLTQGILGLLAGTQRVLGAREAAEQSAREAAQWAPEINTTDQVHDVGTGLRYVAGKFGSSLPYVLPGIAGGMAGRVLGGTPLAAEVGAGGAFVPSMTGDALMRMDQDPAAASMSTGEKLARAGVEGAVDAGIGAVVPGMMGGRLVAREAAPALRELPGAVAKGALTSAAGMGATGAGMDIVGQADRASYDPNFQYDPNSIKEAAVSSAAGMAPFGMVHSAVVHGLDMAGSGAQASGDLAVRGAKGTPGVVADALTAGKAGLDTLTDGAGDLFKTSADYTTKHPELAGLMAKPEVPADVSSASPDVQMNYIRQYDAIQNSSAKTMAQRILGDDTESDGDRRAAQAMLDSTDPQAWEHFKNGIVARQYREKVINGLGSATSWLQGKGEQFGAWAKDKVGEVGQLKKFYNKEATPEDLEFRSAMQPAIHAATGMGDDIHVVNNASAVLKNFVLSRFGDKDGDGVVDVPNGLIRAFGDSAGGLVAKAYDTLRRQGLTKDFDADAPALLKEVNDVVAERKTVYSSAEQAVSDNLVPSMFSALDGSKQMTTDIAHTIASYIDSGKTNDAFEQKLDKWFGPNKEKVLSQIDKLHESFRGTSKYGEDHAPGEIGDEGHGSDKAVDEGRESLTNVEAGVNYHMGDGARPFDKNSPYYADNVHRAQTKLDGSRLATGYDKNVGKDVVRNEMISVGQHAKDSGDNTVMHGLMAEHDLDEKQVNERFQVMRTRDKMPDMEEPVDVKSWELAEPVSRGGKDNPRSWGDVTSTRKMVNGKAVVTDTSTIAHGRIFLDRKSSDLVKAASNETLPKTFVTSAQKLISKMMERKTAGAFDERTAEMTGPQQKLGLFAAGLTSLLNSGKFHDEMWVKMPDGTMKVVNGLKSLPDDFVLYQGKDFKVTMKDALGLTDKASRAEKQAKVRKEDGKEVMPKAPSEKFEVSDIPSMTRDELRAEYAATKKSLDSVEAQRAKLSEDSPGRERLDGVRDGLQTKLDAFKEAGEKRVDNRAPGERKETAGDVGPRAEGVGRTEHHGIGESEEMAASAQREHDNKVRNFDEATGEELHPKQTLREKIAARKAAETNGMDGGKVELPTKSPYAAKDQAALNGERLAEVKFNKEKTGGTPGSASTKEGQEALRAEAHKLLSGDVALAFKEPGVLKGSAEWMRDAETHKGLINIAMDSLDPLGHLYHESMHEFFQRAIDEKNLGGIHDVLRQTAGSELVLRQMKLIMAHEPEVMKQLESNPAERVAYMFQLWAADKIHVGPKTDTVFRKVLNVIRKTLGFAMADQRALEVMQQFKAGNMSDRNAMARILNTQEARGALLRKMTKAVGPVISRGSEWVGFANAQLIGNKNPHLNWVGHQLYNKVGEQGHEQGCLSAKEMMDAQWGNKMANVLRGLTDQEIDLVTDGLQKKEWHPDDIVRGAQEKITQIFKDMWKYGNDAGVKMFDETAGQMGEDGKPVGAWVPMGKIEDYRLPVSWDASKLTADGERFKTLLMQHHEAELRAIADKANKEVAAGNHAGEYTASWQKLHNPDGKGVTQEDIATAILSRMIRTNGQVALKESSNELGFSPHMKAVNERTLKFIDQRVFHEFQEKDLSKVLTTYIGQLTHRAEYSRRFGADGGILQDKMEQAWKHEVDSIVKERFEGKMPEGKEGDAVKQEATKRLEGPRRAIMAQEGTLGSDINPLMRQVNAYTTVYQNIRLLGYPLFSSLIDPVGIMINGGEFKDAYTTLKRGLIAVVKDWGVLTGLREGKESDRDALTELSELVGTTDSGMFMSTLGQTYGSQYLGEAARNMNDKFFRWNGMESFNKAMREGATQAAVNVIKRHMTTPNEHSERFFKEYGLDKSQITIDERGALNVDNLNVQQGIMRWVDGAILRPNAAIRPTRSSDPHYATFYHLKSFMYATQAVILKRVQIEAKNGNASPLMMMFAGYMPMMLAADAAKGILQEVAGGGAPTWEHSTVGGLAEHAAERAGLYGTGQMAIDAVKFGPAALFGPTVEQLTSAMGQPLSKTVTDAIAFGPLSIANHGMTSPND